MIHTSHPSAHVTPALPLLMCTDQHNMHACAGANMLYVIEHVHTVAPKLSTLPPLHTCTHHAHMHAYMCASVHTRDAEGRVYLWDVGTRQVLATHAAHERRVWALDFAPGGACAHPGGGGGSHLLASGSDDHLLKVGTGTQQVQEGESANPSKLVWVSGTQASG